MIIKHHGWFWSQIFCFALNFFFVGAGIYYVATGGEWSIMNFALNAGVGVFNILGASMWVEGVPSDPDHTSD